MISKSIHVNSDNDIPEISMLFLITTGIFVHKFSNYLFNSKNNKYNIKPLECSFKNLLNFNLDETMLYKQEINKDVYLSSNYEEKMNECNNPYYKDLNIEYRLAFEKNQLFKRNIIFNENKNIVNDENGKNDEEYDVIDIEEVNEDKKDKFNIFSNINIRYVIGCNDEDENNQTDIYMPINWEKESETDDMFIIKIKDNNIYNIFSNIISLFTLYYSQDYHKTHINFIYNTLGSKNIFLNHSCICFKNNKYIDFNMINIKDIYGYINYNKKYLDYENINYKLDINKMIDFYKESTKNLKDDDFSKFIININ